MDLNKINKIHQTLLHKKETASKTLEDFEDKLMEKFKITSSEISNPEFYWKKSLVKEVKDEDLQTIIKEESQRKSETEFLNIEKQEAASKSYLITNIFVECGSSLCVTV